MNVSNNKAHDKAVKEFYKYMYSNKGQDTYFIANRSYSIPLNKITYEAYCELNPEMKKMLIAAGVIN
jgi:ABC-type Fe3+ transport system substrate-binding protein